jgi:hypothetical protein
MDLYRLLLSVMSIITELRPVRPHGRGARQQPALRKGCETPNARLSRPLPHLSLPAPPFLVPGTPGGPPRPSRCTLLIWMAIRRLTGKMATRP